MARPTGAHSKAGHEALNRSHDSLDSAVEPRLPIALQNVACTAGGSLRRVIENAP